MELFIKQSGMADDHETKKQLRCSTKWIFGIVCAIIVLIVVVKLGLRRSLL